MHAPSKSNLHAKLLPAILSYGVAGACLYWVFHDLDFSELRPGTQIVIPRVEEVGGTS